MKLVCLLFVSAIACLCSAAETLVCHRASTWNQKHQYISFLQVHPCNEITSSADDQSPEATVIVQNDAEDAKSDEAVIQTEHKAKCLLSLFKKVHNKIFGKDENTSENKNK